MSELTAFDSLASQAGMDLPELLSKFLSTGRTQYGDDWSSTWRERMLLKPPPLISCFDFEWISSCDAKASMSDWLNPDFQSGLRFLPFAESGAGDAYCLMPLADQTLGVAMIAHDAGISHISYASFDNFVYGQLLETLADMEHLLTDFSEQEAVQVVKADIAHIAAIMNTAQAEYLLALSQLTPEYRPYQDGPRSKPRMAWSFISQAILDAELEKLITPDSPAFSIVARWEIE